MRGIRSTCILSCALLVACGGATTAGPTTAGDVSALDPGLPDGADGARLREAIELMDARRFPESIAALEELRGRHPNNGTVLHELGLAYRLSGEPARAVALLEPYEAVLGPTATAGFGSAADEMGDTARAETILRRGIARQPSGLLFSELAVVVARQGRTDEAIGLFLQGMEAEPAWPTNYLHAAGLLADSRAAGMTLLWGEMLRLLEPGSERSQRLAVVMIEVIRSRITVGPPDASGDQSVSIALAPGSAQMTVQQGGLLTMPLVHVLELSYGAALAGAILEGLSLATLHAARAAYFGGGGVAPNTELFEWVAALAAAGHLEAYDVWLFGPAFADEARAWSAAHQDRLEALVEYLSTHPFRPSRAYAPNEPTSIPGAPAPSQPPVPAEAI